MSQLNIVKNDANPDFIYYDVLFSNIKSTTTLPPIFQYQDTRTSPFLMRPDDYALSVVRFTIDTGSLPIFIPTIQSDQSNPNLTIYSVTLEYGGLAFTTPITWIPQDKISPVPFGPSQTSSGLQDNSNGYYNAYSYNYFTYLIYLALLESFNNMMAGPDPPPVNPSYDPVIYPPFFEWDSSSNCLILYAPSGYYDVGNTDAIKIYVNSPLYNLMSSFQATFWGSSLDEDRNVQLLPVSIAGNNVTQLQNEAFYIQVYQEYSTISSWTPISSIVFTTSQLPISATQISVPIVLDNGIIQNSTTANNATSNIITDLVSEDGTYKPNLVYTPPGQNRYVSLYGNTPLVALDLQIFYKLRTGDLVPLRLVSGGTISMKILFQKKATLPQFSQDSE